MGHTDAHDPNAIELIRANAHLSAAKIHAKLTQAGYTIGINKICQIKAQFQGTPQPAQSTPEIQQATQEMRRAAERTIPDHDDEEDPAALWQAAELSSAKAIKRCKPKTFAFRAPEPHAFLTFVSDLHIAPGTPCDFRKMREDAELIRNTPGCYAVVGGDVVDNHIKHRSAVLSARSTPNDQYMLFEHYLTILGNKCLLAISGNHDDWTPQIAGVDMLARIAKQRQIFFASDEAFMDFSIGNQVYKIGLRHQFRMNSSFNQTHSVKQWLRLGVVDWDIGCVGHHHEAAIEQFVYKEKLRWGCRPGSYQITSSYARQLGFNASIPTSPTFLLHGDEHRIDGWASVQHATTVAGKIQLMASQIHLMAR